MVNESRVPTKIDAERAVLGAILLQPQRMSELPTLGVDDFALEVHRRIFAAMKDLSNNGDPIDPVLLLAKLGTTYGIHIAGLTDGLPRSRNIGGYARLVKEAAAKRRAMHIADAITQAAATGCSITDLIQRFGKAAVELADYCHDEEEWRKLFHTSEDFQNAPPLRFAIDGFLQEAGITLIGGLSGHGKTLIMLSIVRSLLEQSPLFGCAAFQVARPATRVLYLVPESSIGPFRSRLQLFRLESHISQRLFVRTLSAKHEMTLTDSRLLRAAEGADVFLDTAVRFMDGAENDVENAKAFANSLFGLLAAGARTITGAHHAPKGFEGQDRMTLENILRGSGDIGAMLCTAWGVRQIDAETNSIYIQNVKPRDFQPCDPFIIEGRPHLDRTGQFFTSFPPGTAGELRDHLQARAGAPETPGKAEKKQQAVSMHAQGISYRKIATDLGVAKSTIYKWLEYEAKTSTNCPSAVDSMKDSIEVGGNTCKGDFPPVSDASVH